MNFPDIYAQIEEELTWRQNEIRFLKNQLSNIVSDSDKKRYRKSLVVMLYSHYEGYCKTVFLIYVKTVNSNAVNRLHANDFIMAASLSDIFKAYGNLDKKSEVFKNSLPADEKLHLFARQVDFVKAIDGLWNELLVIPEDIVDTESNLKPIVMRKILFRLGFEHDCFSKYEGEIHHLLHKRNNVAHGFEKQGVEEKEYDEVEKATYTIMNELKKMIVQALYGFKFLKEPPLAASP